MAKENNSAIDFRSCLTEPGATTDDRRLASSAEHWWPVLGLYVKVFKAGITTPYCD